MRAGIAESALRIVQFHGMVISRSQAILQNQCGNAVCVQPLRYLQPFVVHGEVLVAAARGNHDRRVRGICRWQVNSDRRNIGVGATHCIRCTLRP